jgi:hypothetical protein
MLLRSGCGNRGRRCTIDLPLSGAPGVLACRRASPSRPVLTRGVGSPSEPITCSPPPNTAWEPRAHGARGSLFAAARHLRPRGGGRYVTSLTLGRFAVGRLVRLRVFPPQRQRVVVVDDMEVHSPRRGAEVSLANVERRVEQLARRYNRAVVHFDPTNASLMMENLRGRGLRVHEFRFTAPVNDRAGSPPSRARSPRLLKRCARGNLRAPSRCFGKRPQRRP